MRIKETPTLKQNSNVFQNYNPTKYSYKSKQSLYSEIGSKTLGDQYRPSWELNFIKSPNFQYVGTDPANPTDNKKFQVKFTSSVDLYNSNQEVVPQIDIQTIYSINQIQKLSTETDSFGTIGNPYKTQQDWENAGSPKEYNYFLQDGKFLFKALFDPNGNFEIAQGLGEFAPIIKQDFYLVKDPPVILNVSEYNSFENYEKEEYEIQGFYIENNIVQELTFNKELSNNIFKYINILFDQEAEFDIKVNTKDIYGEIVEKDESTC